ncbi:group III truncated hemoglobin [Paenalcaligenes hominis]|uniref:group III truncated hemoglobin n=1 Tax=Paenalcaligenes hominis TaxID=643674 RepID=UPI003525CE58
MKTPISCSREDISQLVHDFYDQIRLHPNLGPIFNEHIQDWPTHLNTMVSFWSSILLKTGDFSGSPMMKHAALPNLSADLFEQWLQLFHQTCQQQANPELAETAWLFAQRIARSLWMGYQIQQQPERSPIDLAIRAD